MSAHIEHLHVLNAEVGGAARPGQIVFGDGSTNEVAAITIGNRYDGDTLVIEGRPSELLALAQEMVRTAERILDLTKSDAELTALYGGNP